MVLRLPCDQAQVHEVSQNHRIVRWWEGGCPSSREWGEKRAGILE